MGRFSDSPYFLLEAFFDGLSNTEPIEKPILDYEWGANFMSSFELEGSVDGSRDYGHEEYTNANTDGGNEEIVFTDWNANSWNRREYYDPNLIQTFNSYIVSPFINISGKGGGIMSLFVKEPDVGYQRVTVRYDGKDGNRFDFVNSGIKDHEPNGEPETHRLETERMFYEDTPNPDTPFDVEDLYQVSEDKPSDKYLFKFWDTIAKDTFDIFENDREAYFRKDSLYHDFLKVYAKDMMKDSLGVDLDIRNYVNTDKLFSYFHNIYKSHDNQSARIIFDGMKDYVMRAVPEHQRTPRFVELCDIFFDQLYQEVFDLLKNIWSLIDPMEVDEQYLGYLSQYYDMFDVEVEGASLLHTREFIRDMIWMIKRKGTYTEFYILWRILTGTKNILSVYERWHRKDVEVDFPEWPVEISPRCINTWKKDDVEHPYHIDWPNDETTVPVDKWFDALYWNREEYEAPDVDFGAGQGWYNKYYPTVHKGKYVAPSSGYNCPINATTPTPMNFEEELMLSTHYILETDISSEPLAQNEILTKTIWDQMNRYWEYVRPVNRVSNYRIVEAPITDIFTKYVHLYEVTSKSSAFLMTKCGVALDLAEGAYVEKKFADKPRTEWTVTHNLGAHILLQVFDENLDEIVPESIDYLNGTAILTFQTPKAGYAIVKRADWVGTRVGTINEPIWTFYHSQLQKEVIVHYKYSSDRLYAGGTHLNEPPELVQDNTTVTFDDLEKNTAMVGIGNKIIYQDIPSIIWDVHHETEHKGNIVSVYEYGQDGEEDSRVHPSRYNLVDSDNCVLEFTTPTAGYAVFIKVGDLSVDDILEELENLAEHVTWIAYSHDEYGNRTEEDSGSAEPFYSDSEFYYFDLILSNDKTYTINEIEVWDKNGPDTLGNNILFHSLMSNLYKPPWVDMTFHYRLMIPSGD